MGKIFTCVFVSSIGVGTDTDIHSYFYDWSQLPESKYKVSFTFVSGTLNVITNAYQCNLFCDLGQGANMTIASSSTSSQNYSCSFLGCLQVRELAGGVGVYEPYLVADTTTNAPLYLDCRPKNNNVVISLLQTITATGGAAYVPVSGPYTMILTLEMVKE